MGQLAQRSETMKTLFFLIQISMVIAHVGNPAIVYEGNAGDYPIRAVIRIPGVVPGLADITVHSLDGNINHVTTQPMKWDAGLEGSPPADKAVSMHGQPHIFTSELWLMDFGSYSINVDVNGKSGIGKVVIPVNSIATKKAVMNPVIEWTLLFFMVLLAAGFITIVGASIRESTLDPGKSADSAVLKKSRVFMGFAFLFTIAVLIGGKNWWDSIEARYYSNLFKPPETKSSVYKQRDKTVLTLEITDPLWKSGRIPPIVPDHGKMMHTYIMSKDLSVFAHMHPVGEQGYSDRFGLELPEFPSGEYYIYSDVTTETGFALTLLDTISLPVQINSDSDKTYPPDPDNSWITQLPEKPGKGQYVIFADGSRMAWLNSSKKHSPGSVLMDFQLTGPNNQPLPLEPYLEMGGHGIIYKLDGSLFVHIHPTGNFSMASQEVLYELKEGVEVNPQDLFCTFGFRQETDGKLIPNLVEDGRVTFPPFELTELGEYRIWIQVKTDGEVKTGVFDLRIVADENA